MTFRRTSQRISELCVALSLLTTTAYADAPGEGQITVDPKNPRWLIRKGAGPFFLCGPGDPEDFLYRGKRNADGTRTGDQMQIIRKLTGTGANGIYFQAIRSHGGDGDRTHNPFINNDPAKGLNPKVLDQWETWFTELDRANIVMVFFIYDDSARIWKTGDVVGDDERDFLRALVARFKHHKNLIWCIAEEYQERFSAKAVSAIAAVIRNADDRRHPIAVHKLSGIDFTEFADDPNIDQFAIQYNAKTTAELHKGIVEAWKRAGGRYNLNMSECASHGTGATARKKSWACAMAGAYVMVLGMDVATTDVEDLKDCGTLVKFFESTEFHRMSPHDELAAAQTEYVLANPPRSYIAYGANVTGRIGLKQLAAGTYDLLWIDCATGQRFTEKKVVPRKGDQEWAKPVGLGTEVAVHIVLVARPPRPRMPTPRR